MRNENHDHINNAHDKLFKSVFQVKEAVIDFLNYFFPPELTEQLNLKQLKLDNTNYLTSESKENSSDIVYFTTLKTDKRKIAIAFLFEHKNIQPKNVEAQLLTYETGIWQRDVANKKPLTPVICIVFYQGKKDWIRKPFYTAFIDLPPQFRRFVPEFDYHIVSVHQTPDEIIMDLHREHLLGALMLMYKKVDDRDFNQKNPEEFFKYFKKHPEKEIIFHNFVRYFAQYTCLAKDEIVEALDKNFSAPIKSNIMTAYQSYRKEGIDEGLKLGKAEGKAEGIKMSISRFLMKGKLSIPDIAETMDVPVSYVVEIRNELLRSGVILLPLVKDF